MIAALKSAGLFAVMKTLPAPRNPTGYVLVFIYPLFFIFLYSVIGGPEMIGQVLIGIPVIYMINTGIVSLPQLNLEYTLRKLKDIYVASPVTPLAYMLGLGLARLLYVAPAVLLLLLVVASLGYLPWSALPLTLVILTATWLTGCAIGFMMSLYISDLGTMSSIGNLVGLAFAILPPVLYPLDLLDPAAGYASLLVPSVSAAHLIRIMTDSTELNGSLYSILAVVSMTSWVVACAMLVSLKSRWMDE